MDSFFDETKKILVYDLDDGRILFHQNEQVKTKVASLTKIMTTWLALENNSKDKKVKIEKTMLAGLEDFVTAGLFEGQEVSIEELCYISMLPSAGDAAQALAIATSGSIEKFVEKMNKKVDELDLFATHFSNVVGFDEDNDSSAEDIQKILTTALKNPEFKNVFESFEYYSPSLDKVFKKTFENHDVISGGKTGFTYEAGRSLASTATIDGANLLVVDLNENWNSNDHIENTLKIYDYYSKNYETKNVLNEGEEISTIQVKDSATKELKIFSNETVKRFLKNDEEVFYSFDGVSEINKNFSIGDYLGMYKIETRNEVLYEKNFYLEEQIDFYPYWLWNGLVGSFVAVLAIAYAIVHRKKKCVSRRGRTNYS